MNSVAPVPEPDATLVSVVMPVYNAQATMVRSIDSVLAQTHRQLELILVDDGSRDGSAAIMDAYAARDARVVAVRQPNGGVAAARNRGLQEARGTHVAFLFDPLTWAGKTNEISGEVEWVRKWIDESVNYLRKAKSAP